MTGIPDLPWIWVNCNSSLTWKNARFESMLSELDWIFFMVMYINRWCASKPCDLHSIWFKHFEARQTHIHNSRMIKLSAYSWLFHPFFGCLNFPMFGQRGLSLCLWLPFAGDHYGWQPTEAANHRLPREVADQVRWNSFRIQFPLNKTGYRML